MFLLFFIVASFVVPRRQLLPTLSDVTSLSYTFFTRSPCLEWFRKTWGEEHMMLGLWSTTFPIFGQGQQLSDEALA